MKKLIVSLAVAAAAVTSLAACSPNSSPKDAMSPSAMASHSAMSGDKMDGDKMAKSSYITYDDYTKEGAAKAQGPVVFFFAATWCHVCQELDKAIKSDASLIPDGVTLVNVDYDAHTDLRQKYGVTMQHTFVQVDPDGKELAKWSATKASDLFSGIKR